MPPEIRRLRMDARGADSGKKGVPSDGFGKLPNAIVGRGILAHLPEKALKLYLAILLATREGGYCFPSVKTLSRWSGVARGQVSEWTKFLERHRLIVKDWIQVGGKPRRVYRIVPPTDPMFPDYRESCAVCMFPDRRESCVKRDPKTGRLQGKRAAAGNPDHRDAHIPDHRDSPMFPDHRGPKQTEADEQERSRRGEEGGEEEGVQREEKPPRSAPLRLAEGSAPPRAPHTQRPEEAPERKAEPSPQPCRSTEELVLILSGSPNPPTERLLAQCLRHWTPEQIEQAMQHVRGASRSGATHPPSEAPQAPPRDDSASQWNGRCQAYTKARLKCGSWAIAGTPFCRRHQPALAVVEG